MPKCLAKEHCDAFSLKTAGLLRGLMTLLTPLVWIFTRFKMIALKIAGSSGDAPSVTENELKYIVESIEEEGVLEESESEMVRSALDFDETTAEEILTPRVDITFISVDDSPEKIKDIIIENRYSRIPVYEGTVDHVVGILHTRDYLERLADGKAPDVRELMQPPYFVFKTQQLSKILNAFKRTKIHLAVVTDEYGGTLGIVTMEDLLEEIVGDIQDEHDADKEEEVVHRADGTYEFDGMVLLDDITDLLHIKFEEPEEDTIGGLVFGLLERKPEPGDKIEVDGWSFEVLRAEGFRVTRVRAAKQPEMPVYADE